MKIFLAKLEIGIYPLILGKSHHILSFKLLYGLISIGAVPFRGHFPIRWTHAHILVLNWNTVTCLSFF